MTNEIVKLEAPELQGLEKSKAEQIKATFEPMAKMLSEFENQYNELMAIPIEDMTEELTAKYKRLRLDIGKVRIETGKLKDKQKEYIKLEDRAIMGVHNILVWAVKEKEDNLKEREDYFEIQEQKRLDALQLERAEQLSLYVEDAFERNLSAMDNDVWSAYLNTKKKEHEDKIAAEQKAEEDRIAKERAEAEERKRIAAENEKLKKEAEERERWREKREKAEQERKAKEEAERKIREEKERKERAEYEAKIKAEREAREKFEREERAKREKLESELKAKEEAERKAKEEEAARFQAELSKGDEAKVKDLIADLKNLKSKYTFKSAKNQKMYTDVSMLIDKVINHIEK